MLVLQLRDRLMDDWNENGAGNTITDMMVTPATMLQHNWFNIQSYIQADAFNYFNRNNDSMLQKITLLYKPEKQEYGATLNFHLSAREKRDIIRSFNSEVNKEALKKLKGLLQ